ncbi:MAG: phosphatidate cytidylyltransferase, partial [Ferruginibacter sp.]
LLLLIILCGCLYECRSLGNKIKPGFAYFILVGLFYITLPILLFADLGIPGLLKSPGRLNLFSYSPLIPCAVIFSIWINDTMAYVVGSVSGRRQLSKISPNKTWEGTIGGGVLCIIIIGVLSQIIDSAKSVSLVHWVSIAAICALFGTTGDLLESKLKRMAKVKDSGSILPGHGGFLDRFDSFLIATPFVWLYHFLFM